MIEDLVRTLTPMIDPRVFLFIATLASFRLAEMVAIDEGPFDIFFELRSWANDSPLNNRSFKRTFHNVIACVHCAGVWFATFMAIGYLFIPIFTVLIIFPFAIAGLQSILANAFGRSGK